MSSFQVGMWNRALRVGVPPMPDATTRAATVVPSRSGTYPRTTA